MSAGFHILEWASILCRSWAFWRGKTWPRCSPPSETTPLSSTAYDLQKWWIKKRKTSKTESAFLELGEHFMYLFVLDLLLFYVEMSERRRSSLILNSQKDLMLIKFTQISHSEEKKKKQTKQWLLSDRNCKIIVELIIFYHRSSLIPKHFCLYVVLFLLCCHNLRSLALF